MRGMSGGGGSGGGGGGGGGGGAGGVICADMLETVNFSARKEAQLCTLSVAWSSAALFCTCGCAEVANEKYSAMRRKRLYRRRGSEC